MDVNLSLALLTLFIGLSAFFSGTESAYTSLSPAQITAIRAHWGSRGRIVAQLTQRPDRLLSTVLIGNNLANIAASALATQITIRLFGNAAVGVMTGILTLVMLIFAEVTPKQLAIANNEYICVHTARTINTLAWLFTPLILFIGAFSRSVARLGGKKVARSLTLDSILHIVRQAENLGILEQYKSRVVKNLFRFSDIPVSAVMTHRTDVFSLDRTTTIGDAIRLTGAAGFARVPVYRTDPEHIVGVVLAKDLMKSIDRLEEPIKTIMMEPIFMPEHRHIDQAMNHLLREKLNLAIVLDEYGGLSGIVTLEDIVEEIIGEVYDEHEERDQGKITRIGPDRFLIRADVPLSVINDFLPHPLETENSDVHTLGGYIVEALGRIPAKAETVTTAAGEFTVSTIRKNRLVQLTYSRPPRAEHHTPHT